MSVRKAGALITELDLKWHLALRPDTGIRERDENGPFVNRLKEAAPQLVDHLNSTPDHLFAHTPMKHLPILIILCIHVNDIFSV